MAKRGRPRKRPIDETQPQLEIATEPTVTSNGKPPEPVIQGVEWVTVRIPIHTGNMGTRSPDVRIQANLDSMAARETWMRMHQGFESVHAPARAQMLRPIAHTRTATVHALLAAIYKAIDDAGIMRQVLDE